CRRRRGAGRPPHRVARKRRLRGRTTEPACESISGLPVFLLRRPPHPRTRRLSQDGRRLVKTRRGPIPRSECRAGSSPSACTSSTQASTARRLRGLKTPEVLPYSPDLAHDDRGDLSPFPAGLAANPSTARAVGTGKIRAVRGVLWAWKPPKRRPRCRLNPTAPCRSRFGPGSWCWATS